MRYLSFDSPSHILDNISNSPAIIRPTGIPNSCTKSIPPATIPLMSSESSSSENPKISILIRLVHPEKMSLNSGNYQSLPPLKRFTRQHHPLLDKENVDPLTPSLTLPAKKRKESHPLLVEHPLSNANAAVAAYTLPMKKRVWAPPPDFQTSISPLDLNVVYKPCVDEVDGMGWTVLEATTVLGVQSSVFVRKGEEKNRDAGGIEKKNVQGLQNDLILIPDSQAREVIVEEDVLPLEADNKEVPDSEEEDGILCAICQSTDGDPADPIVFCDGCNLMAHATCYGKPLIHGIPDGEWYCHRCLASSENGPAIACCLCPNTGGAMKPTVDGWWAHIVCAVFVPEVFFEDAEGREGINCGGIEGRKSCAQRCYVCGGMSGCLVECSEGRCKRGFHVTCGLEEDLWLDYREGRGKAIVAGFCRQHTELWKKQQRTGKFKIVAREEKQL